MPLAVQNKSCSHMSTATECVSCMCIGLEVFSIVQQRLCLNLWLWFVMQVGLWVIHAEVHGYVIKWNWKLEMESGKEKGMASCAVTVSVFACIVCERWR